jgi:hypothetical protein
LINEEGRPVMVSGKIKISIAGSLPSGRSEALGAAKHIETILTLK